MRNLALLLAVGVLAAGCSTARAVAPVERPALDVPLAPPRVVIASPPPESSPPAPVPDLPPPPAPEPAKPRPAQAAVPGKETQKPEAKPEETAAVAAPPPAQGVPPAPLLRTPATVDTAAAERQIRETIARAQRGLDNVDYQRLSAERQKAYEQAKDFLKSAEAQIKASNFELGKEFAEKAEKLARELQSR